MVMPAVVVVVDSDWPVVPEVELPPVSELEEEDDDVDEEALGPVVLELDESSE
jgi:hypothetical protein